MSKVNWAAGAAVLACTGAIAAYGFVGPADATARTAAVQSEIATTGDAAKHAAASVLPSKRVSAAPSRPVSAAPSKRASALPRKRAAVTPPSVLSGKREVTIVRVQAFESGVSLLNGQLTEVDDDSGRQLFVPTPLGAHKYLIKSYGKANGHPASDEPTCWQVHNPQTTESLTVEGAVCNAKNPDQQFTITAHGKKQYVISNQSAYLQYFPTSGLILEELGDAPLLSTFRFVDNGPARTPAGG
jgi:hypothetical protein